MRCPQCESARQGVLADQERDLRRCFACGLQYEIRSLGKDTYRVIRAAVEIIVITKIKLLNAEVVSDDPQTIRFSLIEID
jgi:uncharacterized Zn finger protein